MQKQGFLRERTSTITPNHPSRKTVDLSNEKPNEAPVLKGLMSKQTVSYVVSNFWQSNRIKAGIHGRECNTLKVITNKFTKISFDAAIFGNELQPLRRKVMRTAVAVVLCTIH